MNYSMPTFNSPFGPHQEERYVREEHIRHETSTRNLSLSTICTEMLTAIGIGYAISKNIQKQEAQKDKGFNKSFFLKNLLLVIRSHETLSLINPDRIECPKALVTSWISGIVLGSFLFAKNNKR